jgi:hypothetical protein
LLIVLSVASASRKGIALATLSTNSDCQIFNLQSACIHTCTHQFRKCHNFDIVSVHSLRHVEFTYKSCNSSDVLKGFLMLAQFPIVSTHKAFSCYQNVTLNSLTLTRLSNHHWCERTGELASYQEKSTGL